MHCSVVSNADRILGWALRVVHELARSGILEFRKEIKIGTRELRNALSMIERELTRIASGLPDLLEDTAFSYKGVEIACDKLVIRVEVNDNTMVEINASTDVDYDVEFEDCEATPRVLAPCTPTEQRYLSEETTYTYESVCETRVENDAGWNRIEHITSSLYEHPVFCGGDLFVTSNLGFSLRYAENVGNKCYVRYVIGLAPDDEYLTAPMYLVFTANIDFEKMTAKLSSYAVINMHGAEIPVTIARV